MLETGDRGVASRIPVRRRRAQRGNGAAQLFPGHKISLSYPLQSRREPPPEITTSNIEMLLRLVTAAALGSLIGFERERLLWAAGIRTHMLVCVGSCLIMIVSQYGFSSILNEKNVVLRFRSS